MAYVTSQENKGTGTICITDIIFLNYYKDGEPKSGTISVELEYNFDTCQINYLDINYSNSDIKKKIEGNPNTLKNIDSYIRNKILKNEFGI